MIIKNNSDVPEIDVREEGIHYVKQQILIGPQDGSTNIIMRRFRVLPGGNTPYHVHPHEHVVKVEKGKGYVVDISGQEIEVSPGKSLFIDGGEKHQFKNPFEEPFEFLCIILNPEKHK
ncbi:MAG: cupin domain-containing protein [Candidatus Aminicenantes bacterium]|nr:cupin domain-containing protein [Candidatus Aminicenantes bacterium]